MGAFAVGNWSRPVISETSAVHPDQVHEVTDFCRSRGVPTEFLPDGRPVIRSSAHKRAMAKVRGYTCRDHYY